MTKLSDKKSVTIKESDNDWMLEELVDWANLGIADVGITIVVNGQMISGKLIGAKEYYYSYGQQWQESIKFEDPKTAETLKEKWQNIGDDTLENLQEKYDEGGEIEPPKFIHLERALLVSANGLIPTGGMLWRGKISEVDGFSLGYLSN